MKSEILIEISDLIKVFSGSSGAVKAVNGVQFSVQAGETLAIVGESGSGKTTLARMILGLEKYTSGSIKVFDREINAISPKDMRLLRAKIQFVQQNPFSQLNRRKTVKQILLTPLNAFSIGEKLGREDEVIRLLESVGLDSTFIDRKPHQLSGGQCQRIAIARALAPKPQILVLDEAVSALDVSIRAQVLNLLKDIQKDLNLTYIFITHDLGVAHFMADKVAVMYQGRVVERGNRKDIFVNYRHHYTKTLISSIPESDRNKKLLSRVNLFSQAPADLTDSCFFRTRCDVGKTNKNCKESEIPISVSESGHEWSCLFPIERENL